MDNKVLKNRFVTDSNDSADTLARSALSCLPGMLGSPSLGYSGVTLIRGKSIRIARALLVTVGSEGSDRR